MIALLCSVSAEAALLLSKTTATGIVTLGSKSVIEGTLADQQVLLCIGGMGKVNAAHAATLMIEKFNPRALIVFGVGGAYPSSGAMVGDVALASEEIAGDEGILTLGGFKDTEYIGIPLVQSDRARIYNRFPVSASDFKHAWQLLSRSKTNVGIHTGTFITLSTCTGTSLRAKELERRYHGICENMEGAAAAQVAELHGVPWLELRGISNIVEDRDLKKWNIPAAADAAQMAVEQILDGWDR
ncbi:MAG TPA: futalosine hydrolase [Nitrospirota bacterium]|nr:futalosine hydrolase [Nitrospirota bacterium]